MPLVEGSGGFVTCRPPPLAVPTSGRVGFHLCSDLHVGAATTDHALLARELRAAQARGDRVLVNGDVFDAVLPKDEKRYRPTALHPRLAGCDDVVGESLAWALEVLAPVAKSIDMIGCGNHDDKISSKHSFDPVRLLVKELRRLGSPAQYGGYCGFIDYRLASGVGRQRQRFTIFYHHGTGGGAALSGVAGDAAKLSWVEGAQVLWLGHKHQRMSFPLQRLCCPATGSGPVVREVRFVRTGAYMNPYGGQSAADALASGRRGNYAADGGYAPQSPGGARVVLHFDKKSPGYRVTVEQ